MEEETRKSEGNTRKSDEHATKPKGSAPGEKRDRADDQADFEESFSAVKTIGASAQKIALFFEFSCPLADVFLISLVPLNFLYVLLAQCCGLFFVLRGEGAEQIDDALHSVKADILCLIVGPLIGRLGLQQQLFRVGAVAEERDSRNQDGQDRDRHGNRNQEGIVSVLIVSFGQFDTFMHFDVFSLRDYAEVSAAMAFSDSRAAATVRSISSDVCDAETKAASNCEGARKMPRSSISRKNLA